MMGKICITSILIKKMLLFIQMSSQREQNKVKQGHRDAKRAIVFIIAKLGGMKGTCS